MAEVKISIRNLYKSFGKKQVLSGVNLDVRTGESLVVIGGSGTGKSVLIKCIQGLLVPDMGSIKIDGEEVVGSRRSLKNIHGKMGMLFQFGALFTDMSVFENVAFPLREQTDFDEEMIRDLVLMKLDAVGLRGAADLMPSAISGGMARRVALARAIALDPALIMYDEPFAGLDPISMGITAQLIRKLTDALQATAIIVTHDVAETFEIADYVYMVNAGRIAAQGTPEELTASTDPYVCQFLKGLPDGPVAFHYPAKSVEEEFGVRS